MRVEGVPKSSPFPGEVVGDGKRDVGEQERKVVPNRRLKSIDETTGEDALLYFSEKSRNVLLTGVQGSAPLTDHGSFEPGGGDRGLM